MTFSISFWSQFIVTYFTTARKLPLLRLLLGYTVSEDTSAPVFCNLHVFHNEWQIFSLNVPKGRRCSYRLQAQPDNDCSSLDISY
jgi:hypothetical protein